MKVAVVGSGVAGLAATWVLNEYSDHEVHLYEADTRPGGHANTVRYSNPSNKAEKDSVDVDTGFIVLNPSTYPNFLRFLNLLAIPTLPTQMTFSVSRDRGLFEWAGDTIFSLFCQPSRVLDTAMWSMIYDILRFNACARRLVLEPPVGKGGVEISIGEYLDRNGYSDAFRDNYLIPMTAAVWSTPADKCSLEFPARTLIQFLSNHHLLQLTGKPSWLTIKGGSKVYVDKIISSLPPTNLHLSTPITSITSSPSSSSPSSTSVTLQTSKGTQETYDHVILACHSDTAVSLLRAGGGVTEDEERILGAFDWNVNRAVLHGDESLMPKSRLAWSCWNYLTKSTVDAKGRPQANVNQVALTYYMNDLQHIPSTPHGPVLVTLNPPWEPKPDLTVGEWPYDHPVLNSTAVKAQTELPQIQNTRGITYAGAWTRYGFHEDGFTSGLMAALGGVGGQKAYFGFHQQKESTAVTFNSPKSIRLPFALASPDRTPYVPYVLAFAFDALEVSGLRTLVGFVLGFCVRVVRWFVGFLFRLD